MNCQVTVRYGVAYCRYWSTPVGYTHKSTHTSSIPCVLKLYVMTLLSAFVSVSNRLGLTFDAHCFHTGTAIKHPVPDWVKVKQSFVIFDIWALRRSAMPL